MEDKSKKELLLKDLCSRLPYDVKVQTYDYDTDEESIETLCSINVFGQITTQECFVDKPLSKPYLFPLSSMTEEQKAEFENIRLSMNIFFKEKANGDNGYEKHFYTLIELQKRQIDWLNKNHFDYNGLIPMGLANDATGLNIY